MLRLGKTPARPGAFKLMLRDFVNVSVLPVPPRLFGAELQLDLHDRWGMLGNATAGNCVWAGAAHETMMWCAQVGVEVAFDDKAVLSDYSAVTGYDPTQTDANGDNPTDRGTDMQVAASYRKRTGIVDASGKRHTIDAYLGLTPGDVEEHLIAAYMFSAVGIGILFPQSAMQQFQYAEPWDVVPGSPVDGGHYVPQVARREDTWKVITWGRAQYMTDAFFRANNDESIVYLSKESLYNNRNVQGFDYEALTAALPALKAH